MSVLEIRKAAVGLDEKEVLELEIIITDMDKEEALRFLKKSIYEKIAHSQQGKLKSHLDSANPVDQFTNQHRVKEP